MDLVYFVLLVSSLIFIHELGHFALAKLFGVKVLTFSVGFGPKLLRLRGKETEYCVAILPFGGFVKMLEESQEGAPVPPEDAKRTFDAQPLWKRAAIVLAGPVMNVLFPVLLYTAVLLEERTVPPPVVGAVVAGKPADGKLMPGDRIFAVAGKEVESFPEVQRIIGARAGQPTPITVQRYGRTLDVEVTPADEVETRELDVVEHVGRIGIGASFLAPVVGVPRPDTPAWRAGLRTFDRLTTVGGRKVERWVDLVDALAENRGDTVLVTYLRPVRSPDRLGGLGDFSVMEPGVATLTPASAGEEGRLVDYEHRAADVLARIGIEPSDMYVAFVPEGSSEYQAGLRAGDRIVAIDGTPQRGWSALKEELKRGASRARRLEWTRAGEPMAGTFQLGKETWSDELGQRRERYVFRTVNWAPSAPPERVPNPHRVAYAIRGGVEETVRVVEFIAVGFLRILQGRVGLDAVSGPITMYDIAGQAGAKGTTYFAWAMAVISVNLGLVNLLPIPVLDGGHLFFLAAEGVRRRPVTRRTRELASLVGMAMLALLMLLAFKNDVQRHWGDLRLFH